MLNTLKAPFLILFILFYTPTIWGQSKVSKPSTDYAHFAPGNTFVEKIYLHSDKQFYVAGEMIWFKLYVLNAATNEKASLSKVAYVDVISPAGQTAASAKVVVAAGDANGWLTLPPSLPGGNYMLRAYTSWMRNFGEAVFFQMPIRIVNTLRAAPPVQSSDTQTFAIGFYPEGGQLVAGLPNTLGVEVLEADGFGMEYQANVSNAAGDSITSFQSNRFGLSQFTFTPAAGQQYNATFSFANGERRAAALPQAQAGGYVMHVEQTANKAATVSIATSGGFALDQLTLTAAGRPVELPAQVAQGGRLVYQLDEKNLSDGANVITLLNAQQQPVCERLLFVKPGIAPVVGAVLNESHFRSRDSVSLHLRTSYGRDSLSVPDLSVSVAWSNGDAPPPVSIGSFLWLASHLRGQIENPGFYFSDSASLLAINNLMLTHGWRRFVAGPTTNVHDIHPLEFNGEIIRALVTDARTNLPASEVKVFLSLPGTPFQLQAATTDALGFVQFDVKNHFGPGELIFQANTLSDSAFKVEVTKPFAAAATMPMLARKTFSNTHASGLLQQSIGMQVQQLYDLDRVNRFRVPAALDTTPFFGRPDYSYPLDAYTRFGTVEEVLREYVRPVSVVQRGGAPHLAIFDEASRRFFNGGELVMVDGIPLFNVDKIFAYDALKLKNIDIVARKFFMGPALFNGILSFTTYKGNYDGLQLDPRAIVVDYDGLQLEREFYSPQYATQAQRESRLPDFRTTLFWTPAARFGSDGTAHLEWYTSDAKGNYLIRIEGLDEHGNPVSQQLAFKVE